jgi:succinate dehydrogenase/fumarate reductase flavoprotein subunit
MSAFDERESEQGEVSRRNFFKGTAAVVGAGLVANSNLSGAQASALGASAAAAANSHLAGYSGDGDWLGTAPVIPDSQITKTVDIDVLVLGAGHAGVLAALGASDKGAKVAVVEPQDEAGFATDYWHRVGEDIGHVNSKWLISRGYGPYEMGEVVAEFVKRAAGRCNPDIIRLFVENSGPMFDRMVEVYESYEAKRKADDSAVKYKYSDGVTETYDLSNMMDEKNLYNQVQKDRSPKDYPIEIGGYKTWPTTAMFQGPALRRAVAPFISKLRWFQKYTVLKTVDNGAQWYYDHTAVVLTQDASGAVTGAIAKDKSGSYVKFNARKGVIVATGDYANNRAMAWDLNNETMEAMERAGQKKGDSAGGGMGGNSKATAMKHEGSGHKMCCWAGGMIENSPRGGMVIGGGASGPWGTSPMLQLNCLAKRFMNEAAAPLVGGACARQPAGIACVVTDKKYLKSIVIAGLEHGGPNFGRKEWYEDFEEDMAKVLPAGAKGYKIRGLMVAEREGGNVIGANTLEELAGYLGYKSELVQTFVESIKHYNELCKKGVDSDYGKDAKAMIAIDEPPFYGCSGKIGSGASFGMVTMSGMVTDTSLRVLDKKGKPIKGLYVAGNTLGGRYGLGYSTPFAGNSIGMAMTHGWLAGQYAAES